MYHFVFVCINDINDSAKGWDHVDVDGTVRENWVLEWHGIIDAGVILI